MKTINYKEPIPSDSKTAYLSHFYKKEKILFFDIETTGFVARNSTLYLIGVLWYENDMLNIRQWFNEDGRDEIGLLNAFEDFCKDFTMLVHFNGLMFDLPYLKQKASLLHSAFTVDTRLSQFDILKELRSYKNIFGLDNMKQLSLEQYLGIAREDIYNGGELIHIYQRYVARPDDEKEQLLLLHNHDDLLGMPMISQSLNYKAFFTKMTPEDITIEEAVYDERDKKLKLVFSTPDFASLPVRIPISAGGIYLNAADNHGTLLISVINDTLKHYFSDYKNYYYLPAEDMAIHKSVALYVEAGNKEKATKKTCYTKVTDSFIPCFSLEGQEVFQYNLTDKQCYIPLNTLKLEEHKPLTDYILQCLKAFI